ncbi:MAG: hypothetical protein WBB73_07965 [Candidatus Aminicenantaceae bacterium]|jgi:Tat protein secretion system quality control protein TatD with DNase activity
MHIGRIALRIPEDRLLTETDNPGARERQSQVRGMPSVLFKVIRIVGLHLANRFFHSDIPAGMV